MRNNIEKKNTLGGLTVILLLAVAGSFAGGGLTLSSESELSISGTSTLHDWESKAEKMSATMVLGEETNLDDLTAAGNKIKAGGVTVKVEALKSGKKKMDAKMYEALKSEQHPEITFKLDPADIVPPEDKGNASLNGKGTLTIAGVSKSIAISSQLAKEGDKVFIHGSETVLMTDYGVEPPKMMMGTIKTGNEVKVNYKLYFEKK